MEPSLQNLPPGVREIYQSMESRLFRAKHQISCLEQQLAFIRAKLLQHSNVQVVQCLLDDLNYFPHGNRAHAIQPK